MEKKKLKLFLDGMILYNRDSKFPPKSEFINRLGKVSHCKINLIVKQFLTYQ